MLQVLPFRTSLAGSFDGLTIGPITLSYQPSESSQLMMTAVLLQVGRLSSWLIVLTRKACSSSGSELPGCPSWYLSAFRKLTAGRLPESAAIQKEDRSYWWFAWSV